MKILLTTHYWWPHVGGIERVALRQAEGLAARGHDVHVLSSDIAARGRLTDSDASGKRPYQVTLLPAFDGAARLSVPWPLFGPGLARRAASLVDAADVVLAHGSVVLPTLASVWHAGRRSRPVVVVQHNPEIAYAKAALNGAQKVAAVTVGRWSLRSAATVVVPSVATRSYVHSLVDRDVEVLPWGLDLDLFVPEPSDDARRRERVSLGVAPDAFLVVAAGRVSAKNRFDVLLRAAALAGRRMNGLSCIVLGGGPDLEAVSELASSLDGSLDVRGHVSDAELRACLRSADVVVATAGGNEGFGLVVAEALASGVPVIAADRGGQVDLVQEGVNGWLFDGSVDGLAGTLERAQQALATGSRAVWARTTRASVESLTWDRHLDRLETVLAGAAPAARSTRRGGQKSHSAVATFNRRS